MEYVSEKHLDKLEKKVEKLDDKIDSVKEDVAVLSSKVEIYTQKVSDHVASDNKIITEILPTVRDLEAIMPLLKTMVLEKKSEEIQELKSVKAKNDIKLTAGTISTVIGVITAIAAAISGIVIAIKSFL